MKRIVTLTLILALGALASSAALAKLPPPVLSDEAKAKAAEAAAKTAHGNKLADFQLCKSMDRVVARYQAEAKNANKEIKPASTTAPSCTDPGPFIPPVATKPIEAAGAHSPPGTANAPPSTTVPAAVTSPTPAKAPASKG